MKIISKDTLQQNSQSTSTTKKEPVRTREPIKVSEPSTPKKEVVIEVPKNKLKRDEAVSVSKPSHTNTRTPEKVKKKNTQGDLKESRMAHLQNEKQKRDTGQSYLSVSYDRFVSLLRFNITFKLTVGYAIRLLFLIGFLFFAIYVSFSYYLYYEAGQDLKEDIRYIAEIAQTENTYDTPTISNYVAYKNVDYYVYDQNYTLLFSSDDETLAFDYALADSEYSLSTFPNFPNIFETDTILLEGDKLYYVALRSDMTIETNTIEATFPIGFVLSLVLVLTSIRSAQKMAKKHMKPILSMTEDVKDMSANNLNTRLNVSGTKDELKDLAFTFNQMLDDIQKSYEREKQFVSDASHELRTPIAVIKGYAGMLNRWGKDDPAILDESIQAILSETDNMHSLVESLLFIARNDKGTLKMDLNTFCLSDLVAETIKETKLIDTQHTLNDQVESQVVIHGSADKLKQALRIFVDNSLKYTPDEGEIKISLRKSEKHAIITLADNGIGISKEDLPNIFDRFYRADKSRTKMKENQHGGTGLGLSIARIIIEQHGGRIHVDSELNVGTTFTLFLPLASSEQMAEVCSSNTNQDAQGSLEKNTES
ncbi:MAG: hypothetical protein BGO41_08525 [Clostridiales bacterium 38-18]|nr:MAG: hypothetical protein BGO41_08525 [Clostridiales bacterium 38-18]